jgi:hypothetical protein
VTPRERLVFAVRVIPVSVVVFAVVVLWPEQPAQMAGGWVVVSVDQAAGHALCVPDGAPRGEDVGEYVRADRVALDRVDRELRDYRANRRPAPPECPVWGT